MWGKVTQGGTNLSVWAQFALWMTREDIRSANTLCNMYLIGGNIGRLPRMNLSSNHILFKTSHPGYGQELVICVEWGTPGWRTSCNPGLPGLCEIHKCSLWLFTCSYIPKLAASFKYHHNTINYPLLCSHQPPRLILCQQLLYIVTATWMNGFEWST